MQRLLQGGADVGCSLVVGLALLKTHFYIWMQYIAVKVVHPLGTILDAVCEDVLRHLHRVFLTSIEYPVSSIFEKGDDHLRQAVVV
jgi:hypothetical protein